MHYVYLENNIVVDQSQVSPFSIFDSKYAAEFIEAPDEVTFDWSLKDGQWIAPVEPYEDFKSINKAKASQLLEESDWTAIPTITDPQYSSPYLTNQSDFLSYRNQLRAIAINPPETLVEVWPTKPEAIWSN